MISAVIEYEDGRVSTHTSKTKRVGTKFQKGFYEAAYDGNGTLQITTQPLEEMHEPYSSPENDMILKTVDNFFKKGIKDSVEQMGFIHKLGILMYGKQGTGKTAIMNSVSKKMIDSCDAIVIFCNSYQTLQGGISLAKKVRLIQDNPIFFIADEFDIYVRDLESDLKNLLDGKDSVSNSLFLAATNYFDRIPDTLKKRPSRFKLVVELFGIENKKTMFDVMSKISNKLKPSLFTNDEIVKLFSKVDSITIDEIKQLALDKLTNTILPEETRTPIGFQSQKKAKGDSSDENPEWYMSEEIPTPKIYGEVKLSDGKNGILRGSRKKNDSGSNI